MKNRRWGTQPVICQTHETPFWQVSRSFIRDRVGQLSASFDNKNVTCFQKICN